MALSYRLDIDDRGSPKLRLFNAQVATTAAHAGKMGGSFGKAGDAITGSLGKMGAGITSVQGLMGGLAIGAIGALIKSSIDAADRLGEMSTALGVNVSQLAGLEYAAKLGGLETENLHKVLKEVATTSQESAAGVGDAGKIYKQLGVEVKDGNGNLKSSGDVMLQLADKFSTMQAGTERTALAVKLFGKQYQQAMTFLDQGSDAIRKNVEEGARLSGITDQSAKAAGEFNDQIDRVKTALQGFALAAVGALGPVLERLNLFLATTSETINQMRLMTELKQNEERAELRLKLLQVARLSQAQKLGVKLNDNQVEYLSRTQKAIAAKNQELGLTDREIALETKRATLRARESLNTKNGAQLDNDRLKQEIAQLEKEIAQENAPASKAPAPAVLTKASKTDDPAKALDDASKMIDGLLRETMSAEVELAQSYSDKLTQLEALDDAHYEALKASLDLWHDYKLGKIKEASDKEQAEARQADLETMYSNIENASKAAKQKADIRADFFRTDKEREINSLKEREELYRESGLTEIEIAAWKAKEIAAIEDKYRQESETKEKDAFAKRMADIQTKLGYAASIAGNFEQALTNMSETEANNVSRRYDNQLSEVREHYTAEIAAAAGNETRQEQLRKQLADKEKAIETKKEKEILAAKRRYAKERKALAIAEATILGAQAIMQIAATVPTPWNIPLIASQAVLTATQVALIASQKFRYGGKPFGKNALVQVNEDGQEIIGNARTTRLMGPEIEAANKGASRKEIAEMMTSGSRQAAPISVSITGVVNESFVRDTIVPALEKHDRRRR